MPSSSAPSTRSRRTFAPVASTACRNETASPGSFATRVAGSSFITLVRIRRSSPSGSPRYVCSRPTSPRRYSLEQNGRSYGGSTSRPASRIEPSKPPACSASAHAAPAAPAPTIRTSTLSTAVVAHELARDVLLEPGVEHHEHLVAGLDHGVRLRHEPAPVAQHGDDERAVR